MRKIEFPTLSLLILASGVLMAEDHEGLPHAFQAGWKGEDVCELVFENDEMRVGKCTFAPGIGHEKHYHNPHFGYILQGNTTFRVTDASGAEEVRIEAGGTWSTDTIRIHEAVNIGDSTASFLMVETK